MLSNSTVLAWGSNSNGQLGLGDTVNRNVPAIVQGINIPVENITAGGATSFAYSANAALAWGYNYFGQLLTRDTTDKLIPVNISLFNTKQITSGSGFTCVLRTNGEVATCGKNDYGELGLGDDIYRTSLTTISVLSRTVTNITSGVSTTFILSSGGGVTAWGSNSTGLFGDGNTAANCKSPKSLNSWGNVKSIECDTNHTIVLMNDGTVKTCGYNTYGQLGLGDTNNRTTPVVVPGISNVKQVACGANFSAALMNDGTVMTWGWNEHGSLGLGNTDNCNTPTIVPGLTGVKEICAGGLRMYAIMDDGTVYGWGRNTYGELGVGDNINRTTPTRIPYFTPNRYYLYLYNGAAYAPENNALAQVSSDFSSLNSSQKKDLFLAAPNDLAPLAQIQTLPTVKILAYKEDEASMSCEMRAIAKDKLVAPKKLTDTSRYQGINKVTLTATLSGGAALKTIVTTDLNSYKTYKNGAWQDIDPTDLTAVAANGIDYAELPNIPRAAWDTLLSGVNKLGFAYLPTIAAVTDQCEVDELTLEVDAKDTWEMALPGTNYTYGYPDQSILRIIVRTDGDYKINYID